MKKLVVNDGKRERELTLVERLVVGRDPACDISHDDALLSRRHAEFVVDGEEVTVRDLGSRNGIFVNGLTTAARPLRSGDVVQIGPLRVRYVSEETHVSVVPEELEMDATSIIAPPDQSDRTLAVPRPAPASARPTERVKPARIEPKEDPDEDTTRLFPTSASADIRSAVPSMPAATDPIVVDWTLKAFVFLQVTALACLAFVTAAVPLIVWRGESMDAIASRGTMALLAWPVLPALITLVTAYMVGTLINARILRAIRTDRERQLSEAVTLHAAAKPASLPRSNPSMRSSGHAIGSMTRPQPAQREGVRADGIGNRSDLRG